jgi:hypothetical protein
MIIQIRPSGIELLARTSNSSLFFDADVLKLRQFFPLAPQFTPYRNVKMSKRGYLRSDSTGLDRTLYVAIFVEAC